jgi:hypothetical protein
MQSDDVVSMLREKPNVDLKQLRDSIPLIELAAKHNDYPFSTK